MSCPSCGQDNATGVTQCLVCRDVFGRRKAPPPAGPLVGTARALVEEGNKLAGAEQIAAGLRKYEEAVTLVPNLALGWLQKGLALGRLERFPEAIDCLNRAAELDDDVGHIALLYKAHALEALRKPDAALGCFRALTTKFPGFPIGWMHLGMAHERGRAEPAALQAYGRFLETARAEPQWREEIDFVTQRLAVLMRLGRTG